MIRSLTFTNIDHMGSYHYDYNTGINPNDVKTVNKALSIGLSSLFINTPKRWKLFKETSVYDYRFEEISNKLEIRNPTINIELELEDFHKKWAIDFSGKKPKVSDKEVLEFGNSLFLSMSNGKKNPVLAYYSVILSTPKEYNRSSQFKGYENCLTGNIYENELLYLLSCSCVDITSMNIAGAKAQKREDLAYEFLLKILPIFFGSDVKLYPLYNDILPYEMGIKIDGRSSILRHWVNKFELYVLYDLIRRAFILNDWVNQSNIQDVSGVVILDMSKDSTFYKEVIKIFPKIQFIAPI